MKVKIYWLFALFLLLSKAYGQDKKNTYLPQLFAQPLTYRAMPAQQSMRIDGSLSEAAWQRAPWSEVFSDIEGNAKPKPALATRVKMLWDDTCLYIATQIDEPQLQASLHQHDTIIYHDNDFEIFIDPDNDTHNYFEIEVNAFNTLFDLFMPKPYRNGADALIGYDIQGLQSAVQIHGTLNKASDTDSGWTVEMAIPFRAINFGFKQNFTPAAGSFYRINFSRVQWDWDVVNNNYVKRKNANNRPLPEHNWVWSPQGLINMHFPERWGYVFFVNSDTPTPLPASEKVKNQLWLLYYKQQDYRKQHGVYATSLQQLGMPSTFSIGGHTYPLQLKATTMQFTATAGGGTLKRISINEEGNIKQ